MASTDDAVVRQGERMSNCMQFPSLRIGGDGVPFLSLDRCRGRCCPVCAPFKARQSASRIADALKEADAVRHIVLTVPARHEDLDVQLDHLTASFRRLRQTRCWKDTQVGAIATIQITRPETSGRWHPHLHILAVGDYLPVDELRDAWDKASHGGVNVWIEPVHSRKTAAAYIASYVASSDQLHRWPPEALLEYAAAMTGRRTLIAVGSMHSRRLPPKDTDNAPTPSKHGISMRSLARAVRWQQPAALLLRGWCSHHSKWAASMLPTTEEVHGPTGARFSDVPLDQLQRWITDSATFDPNADDPAPPPPARPPDAVLFGIRPIHGSD